MEETPETWLRRLAPDSAERDHALAELRSILVRGLRSGLKGRMRSDEAFIQDMTQVSLIRILDRIDSFSGRSRFTTWAVAIAIRVAFNELRRREWKHLSLDALQGEGSWGDDPKTDEISPADVLDQRDLGVELRRLIHEELTTRQRDVLIAELNGMPQEEIVRQLGGTRNSIYKLFHDARKALKHALDKRGVTTFEQAGHLNHLPVARKQ